MAYIGLKPTAGENNSFRILDTLSSFTATFDGSSASIVSVGNDTISLPDHRFLTGQRVTYNDGGGTAIKLKLKHNYPSHPTYAFKKRWTPKH